MKRAIATIAATAVFALTLTACGSDADDDCGDTLSMSAVAFPVKGGTGGSHGSSHSFGHSKSHPSHPQGWHKPHRTHHSSTHFWDLDDECDD